MKRQASNQDNKVSKNRKRSNTNTNGGTLDQKLKELDDEHLKNELHHSPDHQGTHPSPSTPSNQPNLNPQSNTTSGIGSTSGPSNIFGHSPPIPVAKNNSPSQVPPPPSDTFVWSNPNENNQNHVMPPNFLGNRPSAGLLNGLSGVPPSNNPIFNPHSTQFPAHANQSYQNPGNSYSSNFRNSYSNNQNWNNPSFDEIKIESNTDFPGEMMNGLDPTRNLQQDFSFQDHRQQLKSSF